VVIGHLPSVTERHSLGIGSYLTIDSIDKKAENFAHTYLVIR
jgi:hypothetical protein